MTELNLREYAVMFGAFLAIELVAADTQESGGLGLVPLTPVESDIKDPAGDCFHGDQVRVKGKVVGNGAAGRQNFFLPCVTVGHRGVADDEVLGLDQTVANDGGALQAVAEFPDVAGPMVGEEFVEGFLRDPGQLFPLMLAKSFEEVFHE